MLKNISLVYFIILATIANGQNQKLALNQHPSLYFCMHDLGPSTLALCKQYGILNAQLIGVHFSVDSSNMTDSSNMNFIEDTADLFKQIKMYFPNKEDSGIGVLDMEGVPREMLKNAPEKSASFTNAFNFFSRVLAASKSYRPNVYWGYYATPFTTYWNRNQKWKELSNKVTSLLKQCDILFPSQYCFYPESFSTNADHDYVNDNMTFVLQIGRELNRPVMPFVWHRYHPSNSKVAYKLIPIEDFKKHIEYILQAKYKDTRVQGVILWGSDLYYFNQRTPELLKEAPNNKSFETYHDSLLVQYINELLPLFR